MLCFKTSSKAPLNLIFYFYEFLSPLHILTLYRAFVAAGATYDSLNLSALHYITLLEDILRASSSLYFPPGRWFPATDHYQLLAANSYTATWLRHMCVNHLHGIVTWWQIGQESNCNCLMQVRYCHNCSNGSTSNSGDLSSKWSIDQLCLV